MGYKWTHWHAAFAVVYGGLTTANIWQEFTSAIINSQQISTLCINIPGSMVFKNVKGTLGDSAEAIISYP